MGVVIEKLPHPNKLTQQITKKWKRFFFFFGKRFPREREDREKSFRIFKDFLEFFYSIFSSLFYQKFLYFLQKKEGVFIGGMKKWGLGEVYQDKLT